MFGISFPPSFSLVVGILMTSATQHALGQGPFISPACISICDSDAGCEQDCQIKLNLYNSYMAQLDVGVNQRSLTQLYIDILQPFYTGADLRSWRFGFGDRQPEGNATTDCSTTYFNNSEFVNSLAGGQLSSDADFAWLLHELQHYVQCNGVGGRAAYAVMWFRDLSAAFVQNADLATLHDRMPMEADADAVRDSVFAGVAPSRGTDGRFRRTMTMELRRNGQLISEPGSVQYVNQNVSQTFAATVTGFSSPPPFTWSIRPLGHAFATATGSGPNGAELLWTPAEIGTYDIRVIAGVVTSTSHVSRVARFRVLRPGESAPNAPVPSNTYETLVSVPKPLRVTLGVRVNRQSTQQPVKICVDDNQSGANYARANIYGTRGQFTVRKNREFKVVVSGSGFGGPFCTGPQ
jgi:hypothetical protein